MLTLTCCCRQSRVQWREQSTAALNAAMFYTLLVNLVHAQCVHMLIVISTYYIFCVHNILLLLSFSTQSYSLDGIVTLLTLYLHAPWVVAVMCIHCAEALAICWTSTTEASAGYCFDCHIVYIFFRPGSHVTMGKYRNIFLVAGMYCNISKKSHDLRCWIQHQQCLWNYGFPWHKYDCMRLLNKHVLCTWGDLYFASISGTFFTFCTLFEL